jgi:hypothetical protein
MLQKLLKSADLRQLTSFVSPAFFDVMPAGQIWSRGRGLITSRSRPTYTQAVQQRAAELAQLPLAVRLPGDVTQPVRDDLGGGVEANATRLVVLYFEQIFSDAPTLLDLRGSSCRTDGTTLGWDPAPWVCSWDKDFQAHLRELYLGFYGHDDAMFRRALTALKIEIAEDLFRQHFSAEQSGVDFAMRDFVDTFHQVFVRCKERKIRLHADFLPLGVYLATLYEHLDGIGVKVDVRSCYERVTRGGDKADSRSATVGGARG